MHQIEIGWGFAPDLTGGAHDAPPDSLVGWGGDTPSPYSTPSAPSTPRSLHLRRSICVQLKIFLILSPGI